LKTLGCGFSTPVGIVYDPLGPPSGVGRHFFLEPASDGQWFDLRSIQLDQMTPINAQQTLSWGRFTQALDSLAVHPNGFVVGVNRQNHKMEMLELPEKAVDTAVAPTAVPFGVPKSGLGDRAGLLNIPVAVTVWQGVILVLEQGNRRVQAFDVFANPVNHFGNPNQRTSLMPLRNDGPDVTYLDLGVEAKGYLYVLSYINDGLHASDYQLDIYTPDGTFLTRTTGVAAARMAVDTFRNVYTLNYEMIANAPHIEPSLSQWAPSTLGV
jgi:hypothetical protein